MSELSVLTKRLGELAKEADDVSWPEEALRVLADAGCFANTIARRFGGNEATPRRKIETYEAVARGSLTLALILTQHDAACELLGQCDNETIPHQLLPRCAAGDVLMTVGISQLTTSRRGQGPAMRAEIDGDDFRLTGTMPWVTSSPNAHYVVTGAVLPDNRQLLACVATDAAGLTVKEPMRFVALNASLTGEIQCDNVLVSRENLLRGPCEKALARRSPVKPLSVSAVATGLAGALLDGIRDRAPLLADAASLLDRTIVPRYEEVRRRLYQATDALKHPDEELPGVEIRVAANELVVCLAATYMTLAKGSGYLSTHPAQRLCREAMFFLVWSAPPSVQHGTIKAIWG